MEVAVLFNPAGDDDDGGGVLSAIGHEFDVHPFTYTTRDVILYALGGKRSHDHTLMYWIHAHAQLVLHYLLTTNQS